MNGFFDTKWVAKKERNEKMIAQFLQYETLRHPFRKSSSTKTIITLAVHIKILETGAYSMARFRLTSTSFLRSLSTFMLASL